MLAKLGIFFLCVEGDQYTALRILKKITKHHFNKNSNENYRICFSWPQTCTDTKSFSGKSRDEDWEGSGEREN